MPARDGDVKDQTEHTKLTWAPARGRIWWGGGKVGKKSGEGEKETTVNCGERKQFGVTQKNSYN